MSLGTGHPPLRNTSGFAVRPWTTTSDGSPVAETYTKLLSSLPDSSVWREPHHVRIVWVTMLAMADRDGYVWASVGGLTDRARVSSEQCLDALAILLSPDPDSRCRDYDGRRIEEVERGWFILNHGRIRDMRDEDAHRAKEREKKRAQRAKAKAERDALAMAESPPPVPPNDFDGSPDETICPLNLAERAEPVVIPELAKKLKGATVEQVRDSVNRCVAHYTIGPGMGQRRRHWLRIVRGWVTKDHGDKNLARAEKQPRNVASQLRERADRLMREAKEREGKAAE